MIFLLKQSYLKSEKTWVQMKNTQVSGVLPQQTIKLQAEDFFLYSEEKNEGNMEYKCMRLNT